MYLTTKGLVLRVTSYNDHDSLLTLLTPNHGKLTVKARGLRRKNSPLTAPCQLLAFGEFTLFEYRSMYTINEAFSVELFTPLRRDLQKLSLGTYFAQAAELLSQEDLPNPELLSLVLNCLHALSKMDVSENLVKAVFELRLMCLSGYVPFLDCCTGCGCENSEFPRFSINGGNLHCAECPSGSVGISLPLCSQSLAAMRYITIAHPKKIFSFSLEGDALKRLCDACEGYVLAQLERGFSSLDSWKCVNI